MPLLAVENLAVVFPQDGGAVTAVDGVSLSLDAGETLALVGESGCGKSVTGLSLMGLTPVPGKVTAGSIRLEGRELEGLSSREWEAVRGKQIGMIFQDPLTALDPVYTAGEQIAEGLRFHFGMNHRDAWKEAVRNLAEVGITDPGAAKLYPHQLSGGMRQRVMIAAAIVTKPQMLIADEPTTALDVTVQSQIIDLLQEIQAERKMALLLITHDLGVVARMANRVAVMYAGQIVETGTVDVVLREPAHPYTAGLLSAVPRVGAITERLVAIEGTVPSPGRYPAGCRFRPRCPCAVVGCDSPQVMRDIMPGREARCLYPLTGPPGVEPAPNSASRMDVAL